MRKFFIGSCLCLLTITTGLFSKPSIDARPISEQLSELRYFECESVPLPQGHPRTKSKASSSIENTVELSTNWAGYQVAECFKHPEKDSVTQVSGSWVVPTVQNTSGGDAYSSIWVGIDDTDTVEQTGTGQDFVAGAADYFAWYEVFPEPLQVFSGFPLEPGDLVGAETSYIGDGKFRFTFANFTKGLYTQATVRKTGTLRGTGQWIVEAPSLCNPDCEVQPLVDFGTVKFTHCVAKVEGHIGSITDDHWDKRAIVMVQNPPNSTSIKALPSNLKNEGTVFKVFFRQAGP